MKKVLIPVILATVMMMGATFAVMPVEKASTVHTTIIAAINNAFGPGSGGNLVNRDENSTFKETIRGDYAWTVAGSATNVNGTTLVNFANAATASAPVSKLTGYLTVFNNSTTSNGRTGTMVITSANGTLFVKESNSDPSKTIYITLGGTGLDLTASNGASNIGTVQFAVVKVD